MTLDLRTAERTSTFGVWEQWRKNAGLLWHGADDLPSPLGNPILAPDAGKVVYSGAGWSVGTLGYYTIFDAGAYGLLMAHQDRAYPELVRDGVKRGDVIGYSGNTGWSTGPHVHLLMSVKRYSNGAFDFTREGGGLVSPDCYWNVGYGSEAVWLHAFNRDVSPGRVWAVATMRVVTKAELGLMPVETVTILQAGRWLMFSPASPAWVNATFPDVVHANTVLMVTPRAGADENTVAKAA